MYGVCVISDICTACVFSDIRRVFSDICTACVVSSVISVRRVCSVISVRRVCSRRVSSVMYGV